MNFLLETRALPTDAWARLSGVHKSVHAAAKIAAKLAAAGSEVRLLDETEHQVFQWRKPMGSAYAHSTRAKQATAGRTDFSTLPGTSAEKAKGAAA